MKVLVQILALILSVVLVQSATFKIQLSAKDLPNRDIANGKPDAYVKILKAEGSSTNDRYTEGKKLRAVNNNNNPTWPDPTELNFMPGAYQRLRFEVWDDDVGNDDYMGKVDITYAQIANLKESSQQVDILGCPGGTNCGRLVIDRLRNK